MSEGKAKIIEQLMEEYDIETPQDIYAALRDLLGWVYAKISDKVISSSMTKV